MFLNSSTLSGIINSTQLLETLSTHLSDGPALLKSVDLSQHRKPPQSKRSSHTFQTNAMQWNRLFYTYTITFWRSNDISVIQVRKYLLVRSSDELEYTDLRRSVEIALVPLTFLL